MKAVVYKDLLFGPPQISSSSAVQGVVHYKSENLIPFLVQHSHLPPADKPAKA